MQLEKEIARAVKHIAAIDTKTAKTQSDLDMICEQVLLNVKAGNYDFTKVERLVINQNGKKRLVKQYLDSYF